MIYLLHATLHCFVFFETLFVYNARVFEVSLTRLPPAAASGVVVVVVVDACVVVAACCLKSRCRNTHCSFLLQRNVRAGRDSIEQHWEKPFHTARFPQRFASINKSFTFFSVLIGFGSLEFSLNEQKVHVRSTFLQYQAEQITDKSFPCLTWTGTTKWVHRHCLDHWRARGQGQLGMINFFEGLR